jgi:hypothetical protein
MRQVVRYTGFLVDRSRLQCSSMMGLVFTWPKLKRLLDYFLGFFRLQLKL